MTREASGEAGYKKEVGKLTKRATGRGVYRVTRCAVGTRLVTVGRGEAGWEGRRESVNDMYTQTGRTGRKEGKTPRKTKPSRGEAEGRERIAEGTRLWDVLVPLTILNHPVYSPLVFPSSTLRRPFAFPYLPCPPPPSLLSCQPLLFVAHAPMRNKHCSKMVSPDRASPASQVFVARYPRWPKHESFRVFFFFHVEIVRAIVNKSTVLKAEV